MECTWDEDDVKRSQITRKKISEGELEKLDLENYLASDSDNETGFETSPFHQTSAFILFTLLKPILEWKVLISSQTMKRKRKRIRRRNTASC